MEWLRQQWATIQVYQRTIVRASVALLVVCIGGLSWYGWSQYQQRQGVIQFRTGLSALAEEDYPGAIGKLTQAEEILRGESRGLALLHLGEAYEKNNQAAEAKAAYERAAASNDVTPYLKQVAYLRLGQGAEQAKELDAAAQWYREASALEGPGKGEALLALGETFELKGGEGNEAVEIYADLLEQQPDAPLADLVKAKTGQ